MVNFDSGDWVITTTGSAIDTFTDARQKTTMNKVVKKLRDNPTKAFNIFADKCETYLIDANKPVEETEQVESETEVEATETETAQAGDLNSVHREPAAKNYVRPGSMKLTTQTEQFLNKRVDRVAKSDSSQRRGCRGGSGSPSQLQFFWKHDPHQFVRNDSQGDLPASSKRLKHLYSDYSDRNSGARDGLVFILEIFNGCNSCRVCG